MLILGINTATARAEIALVECNGSRTNIPPRPKTRTLFSKSWISRQDEGKKVLPSIRAALNALEKSSRRKVQPAYAVPDARPAKIFVVSGPGAFTGLRIGVTIANTLAFVHRAPIIATTTFEYLRAKIPAAHKAETALLLKAGGEFAAVVLPQAKQIHRINKNELADFFARHKKIKYLVGDMAPHERKKYSLPPRIKWLPEKSLATLPEVMQNFLAARQGARITARTAHAEYKIVKPHYLLPPKITQSKKPVFA